MTYEEYINMLNECVKDTDKINGSVEAFSAAYKEQLDNVDALQKEVDDLKAKNDALRDDNTKLVLARLHNESVGDGGVIEEETRAERVARYAKIFRNDEEN